MDGDDWVSALSKCSAQEAFVKLQAGIARDVQTRNAQRRPQDDFEFKTQRHGPDEFSVFIGGDGGRGHDVVRFRLEKQQIHILSDSETLDIVVKMTLNLLGQCRFVVGDRELEEWHVRKMALEKLLFHTV